MNNQNPLLDFNFLYDLDQNRNKITYARITSLTADNYPCEQIEGVITAGSINLDGASAVRRVCSLTLTTDNLNINNIYWALTTKIKIEIGIENNLLQYHQSNNTSTQENINYYTQAQIDYSKQIISLQQFNTIKQAYNDYLQAQIDYSENKISFSEFQTIQKIYENTILYITNKTDALKNYPDIIWFPQGIFILTDFKPSAKVNNYSIKITGKDKMCLLNGDVGGVFNAETQLDIQRIQQEDGGFIDQKLPIASIIREMIHYYGQESFHNIVIKDIDTLSLKMLTNNSGQNFYLIQDLNTEEYVDVCCGSSILPKNEYYYLDTPDLLVNFSYLKKDFVFKIRTGEDGNNLISANLNTPTILIDKDKTHKYIVIKIEDGDDIGYEMIETIYPSELIAAPGETVTSILDKIIKTFGAYEYFYNVEGQFVFQAKETYVNTAWNNMKVDNDNNQLIIEPQVVSHLVKYSFDGGRLVTAYSNNPQIGKIKNDFTVWGKRKLSSGEEIPIHVRYAIDKKPLFYCSYDNTRKYISEDFYNYTIKLKYIHQDINSNQVILNDEIYNIVDWREIIYQMAKDYLRYNHDDDFEVKIQRNNFKTFILKNSNFITSFKPYESGRTGYEQYYHDIEGFWRTLYMPKEEIENIKITDRNNIQIINKENFYDNNEKYIGPWNKYILLNPSSLLFWFDFFDADSLGLGQFSVSAIGDRPKVINNDNMRAIIYKSVPNLVLISEEDYHNYKGKGRLLNFNYSYIFINRSLKQFMDDDQIRISTRSITGQEIIDDLIYKNAYSNETITLQAIPIYYLQPNTIISARDEERGVNGYYIINKITLPLDYKGVMKITAIKVPERLY